MQKQISFSSDNYTIQGKLIFPNNQLVNPPGIMFIHGWMSNQNRYTIRADALAKLGFLCLTFDLPGHGESSGDINYITRNDFIQATIVAYDFLKQQSKQEKISVVGTSFGGYLAAHLTAERKIHALALRAPADYRDEEYDKPQIYWSSHYETDKWRTTPLHYTQNKILQNLHDFPGDILFIESEKDEQVPHQVLMNYKNAVSNPEQLTYVVMKDASHSLHTDPKKNQEFTDILIKWFRNEID